MKKRLEGVTVGVLAVDGFEQVEVTVPLKALKKAGADVRILSLRPGRIRGVNFIWRGRKLPVDDILQDAVPEQYGALLLPGGFVNPDLLRQSQYARQFVKRAEALRRPLAVICHGAELLISAGLIRGRRLATWPGIADDVRNAGAEWVDEPLVRDDLWVSSRGPQDLAKFVPAMVELFATAAPRFLSPPSRKVRWVARLLGTGTFGVAAGALAMMARPHLGNRVRSATARKLSGPLLMGAGLLALAGIAGGRRWLAPGRQAAPSLSN